MRARTTLIDPETNAGKLQKLSELNLVYARYLQACVCRMIQQQRIFVSLSEMKRFFPEAPEALTCHIVRAIHRHAVSTVNSWAKSLYQTKLKRYITDNAELTDEQKAALYTIGKHAIEGAGMYGKYPIPQHLVDLYFSWLFNPEISGQPPTVSDRCPMWMGEMTCEFRVSKTPHFSGWWLRFATLEARKRISVPLSSNPFLTDPKLVAKGVMVRQDRRGRWSVQFVDKSGVELPKCRAGKIGVDVGLSCLAATSDGRLYGQSVKPIFDKKYNNVKAIRANRQRQNLPENSPRLDRLEQNLSGFVKTEIGRVANQLVHDYPDYTFVVEDLSLKGSRGQKRFAYTALHRSLATKARTKVVNPAYTSIECPSCGYIANSNRSGIRFSCRSCGRNTHADVVGGINLLGRSADKQIDSQLLPHQVGAILRTRWRLRRNSVVSRSKQRAEAVGRRLTVAGIRSSRSPAKPRIARKSL